MVVNALTSATQYNRILPSKTKQKSNIYIFFFSHFGSHFCVTRNTTILFFNSIQRERYYLFYMTNRFEWMEYDIKYTLDSFVNDLTKKEWIQQ